jgi:hypothetical protein
LCLVVDSFGHVGNRGAGVAVSLVLGAYSHTEIDVTASMRLFVLGGLLVLAGLGAGFWPLSTTSIGLACGSAFTGVTADQVIVETGGGVVSDCANDRNLMRIVAVGLLVAGGVSAAAGWRVAGVEKRQEPSPSF